MHERADACRSFGISPARRLVLWWIFGPLLLGGLALAVLGAASERAAGVAIAVLMAAVLAGWEWLVSRTRLEISADGVRLRQLGMGVEAKWTEIAEFRGERGREGFVTTQPLQGPGARRLAVTSGFAISGAPLYEQERRRLMAEQRWIPIEPFAWHLRRGALAAELLRVAPPQVATAVAQAIATPPAAPRAATARERRGLMIAVLVIAVSLAAGVALALAPAWQGVVFTAAAAVITPVLTLLSALSTSRCWRQRAWWLSGWFALLTLVMALSTVAAWTELWRIIRATSA